MSVPVAGGPTHILAVSALVVKDGRVLAMRRAATKDAGAGLWETLSGRVEPGEEPLAAVRREILEETGLDVEVEERPLTAYLAERLGVPMVLVVYRARWRGGEVVRSDEHDAHAWLTAEEFARRSELGPLVAVVRAWL